MPLMPSEYKLYYSISCGSTSLWHCTFGDDLLGLYGNVNINFFYEVFTWRDFKNSSCTWLLACSQFARENKISTETFKLMKILYSRYNLASVILLPVHHHILLQKTPKKVCFRKVFSTLTRKQNYSAIFPV